MTDQGGNPAGSLSTEIGVKADTEYEYPPSLGLRWLLAVGELGWAVAVGALLLAAALLLLGLPLESANGGVLPVHVDVAIRAGFMWGVLAALAAAVVAGFASAAAARLPRRGPAPLTAGRGPDVGLTMIMILVLIIAALMVLAGVVIFFEQLDSRAGVAAPVVMTLLGLGLVLACVLGFRWLKKGRRCVESPWIPSAEWNLRSAAIRAKRGYRDAPEPPEGPRPPLGWWRPRMDKAVRIVGWIVGAPALLLAALLKPPFPGAYNGAQVPIAIGIALGVSVAAVLVVGVIRWVIRLSVLVRAQALIRRRLRSGQGQWPARFDRRLLLEGASPGRTVFRAMAGAAAAAAIAFGGWAISVGASGGWPDTSSAWRHAVAADFIFPADVAILVLLTCLVWRVHGLGRDAEVRNFIREIRRDAEVSDAKRT